MIGLQLQDFIFAAVGLALYFLGRYQGHHAGFKKGKTEVYIEDRRCTCLKCLGISDPCAEEADE